MMKKIKFIWECAEPAERVQAIAYACFLSFAVGFIAITVIEWLP